jgi:tRNA/tmRNA/rRNA uracil-C5-methylase (TrmA/RlmC/RlmD family)
LLDLTVGDVAQGGWCVARDQGQVVFVRHALPGERVTARVTEVTSKFARADAVEVLEPSADRVEAPCPHARPGGCGGCDWQHATLPVQRELKAAVIRQQFRRIAGIDVDVVVEHLPGDEETGDQPGLGWRTRVQFAVRGDGVAGLRAHRSHEVIDVGDCLIAHPGIRDLGIPRRKWPGVTGVEAIVAVRAAEFGAGADASELGERAVVVSSGGRRAAGTRGEPGRGTTTRSGSLEGIAAESVLTAAGRGGALTALRGRSYLQHRAAGRNWRVSVGSFWQVHPGVADALCDAVLGALGPAAGDTALDLYCGVGLFAGVLAAAVGPDGSVTGVESDAGAVRDARSNLRGMPWARIHRGDVAEVLSRQALPVPRLAVLDPPRAGVTRPVIEYLVGMWQVAGESPPADRRIAYVSCDPATLARDIAVFAGLGWELENLRAFDAFPMTYHVECVATLARP